MARCTTFKMTLPSDTLEGRIAKTPAGWAWQVVLQSDSTKVVHKGVARGRVRAEYAVLQAAGLIQTACLRG